MFSDFPNDTDAFLGWDFPAQVWSQDGYRLSSVEVEHGFVDIYKYNDNVVE